MAATKHSPRRCTICRDYARHERRALPLGNWTRRLLGRRKLHLYRGMKVLVSACGGQVRRPGMMWTMNPACVTCRRCRRAVGKKGR